MTADDLRSFDAASLADYLWRRLRLEEPVDPPVDQRFRQEPPEEFIILAADERDDPEFRRRLAGAIRDNLTRLTRSSQPADSDRVFREPVADQQIASLAFLISALKATDLVRDLLLVAYGWLVAWSERPSEPSDGQFHVLRTLAHLQSGPALAGLWEQLWRTGPRSLRGLIVFGWARADATQALAHLDELVESAPDVDLGGTMWSLIGREGPGILTVAKAARNLSPAHRSRLREVLQNAGAEDHVLRDFDQQSTEPAPPAGDTPWLEESVPQWPEPVRAMPPWSPPEKKAA